MVSLKEAEENAFRLAARNEGKAHFSEKHVASPKRVKTRAPAKSCGHLSTYSPSTYRVRVPVLASQWRGFSFGAIGAGASLTETPYFQSGGQNAMKRAYPPVPP